MNHYNQLTHLEKLTLIAEMQHVLSVDPIAYLTVRRLIKNAKEKGKFDKVSFHPEKIVGLNVMV